MKSLRWRNDWAEGVFMDGQREREREREEKQRHVRR